MRVDIGGRRSGKTTRAVEWARRHPEGVLIVQSEKERERLLEEPHSLKKEQVVAISAIQRGALTGRDVVAYIDNLEAVLWLALGRTKVEGFSLTIETEFPPQT